MTRSGLLLSGSVALALFIACGGDDDNGGGGNNNTGTGGSSTAGSTGTSGGSTGTTGGTTGTTGGTTGTTGGTTGTGGTGGTSSGAFTCAGTVPTAESITDFSDATATGTWGGTNAVSGGTFVYPTTALTADYTGMSFAVSGEVADYSGFGLWFATCLDASSFDGIAFNVSGDAGAAGTITIALQTNSDMPIDATGMKGACAFTSEATKYSECVFPTVTKDVPMGGGVIEVAWSEFVGGKPVATADPTEIVGIQWSFAWAGATDMAYNVDVTVDDVTFLGEVTGGGGAGAGGGSGTGEGGAGGAG